MSLQKSCNYQVNEHVYAIDPHLYYEPERAKIFLIGSEKKALIDLAASYTVEKICEGIEAVNHSIDDLDFLFFTHCHCAHAGCIAAMAPKMPKAQICASLITRNVLRDPALRFLGTVFVYGQEFWSLAGSHKPLMGREVRIIAENDTFHLGKGVRIRVLEFPGHDSGNLGFLEEKTKTLFVGDSLGLYMDGGFYNPAAFPNHFNYYDQIQTLERVMSLDFDYLCYSHVGCFTREEGKEIVQLGIRTFKAFRKVVEEAARENPSLEHIFERLMESEVIVKKALEKHPENLVRNVLYAQILGFAHSLGIEVPAEPTINGWRTP